MPTRISFHYANPTDPAAFEQGWADGHLDLVRALPGVRRVTSARVWPKEDGSPTPMHRVVDAEFDDYDAASAAVRTPEAAVMFPAVFALGTGGVTVLFTDVESDG